jgi:chemotaxis signal transduction protein
MPTYARLKVAAEAYAVPIANVVEIANLGHLTAVPGTRQQILGVRNLRGQILPVIDLALLLGLSAAVPPGQLLVIEAGSVKGSFAIDEVSDVGELPDPTEGAKPGVLLGAMLCDGELIGVIDVPGIFGSLQRRRSDD